MMQRKDIENKEFVYETGYKKYNDRETIMELDKEEAAPLLKKKPYKIIGLEGKDFQELYDKLGKRLNLRDREGHAIIAFTVPLDLTEDSIAFAGWKIALELFTTRGLIVWSAVKGKHYALKCQLFDRA